MDPMCANCGCLYLYIYICTEYNRILSYIYIYMCVYVYISSVMGITVPFGVTGEKDNSRRMVEFCEERELCVGNIF